MVFLILLIIATGVLTAWLLVALTRVSFSDLRMRVPHPTRVHEPHADPRPVVAMVEPVHREPLVDPELDAERAVREHLYGRSRGRA